jgi:hypothetical protein
MIVEDFHDMIDMSVDFIQQQLKNEKISKIPLYLWGFEIFC